MKLVKRMKWVLLLCLGILCSFFLSSLLDKHEDVFSKKSLKGAVIHMSLLVTALEKFKENTGHYPSTQEGLNALIKQPQKISNWKGPYLTEEEMNFTKTIERDVWGTKYVYVYPAQYGSHEDYDLYSCGQDKINNFGEGDDISNWKEINKKYYKNEKFHETTSVKLLSILLLILFMVILLSL